MATQPQMIPLEHQDLKLQKGSSKWRYEVNLIRNTYGLEHPDDDFVRMFACRSITAELKVWYVQKALMQQGSDRR